MIITAITTLAHVLGLTVVAEGVQTPGQHRQLRAVGCDLAQGYLYARPVSANDIDTWLAEAAGAPWQLTEDAAAVG